MRFLFIDTSERIGGAGIAAAAWAGSLRRRGFEVAAYVTNDQNHAMRRHWLDAGVPTTRGRITLQRDTVAIFNTSLAARLVAQLSRQAPVVWLFHQGFSGLRGLAEQPDIAEICRRVRAFVFETEMQRRDLFRPFMLGVPESRVHVVPPAALVLANPPEREAEHRPTLRVVSVGAIGGRKRQDDLLLALARLNRSDVSCDLVGRVGELSPEALAAARSLSDRLRFLGEVTHPEALAAISASDALALPSDDESLPRSVLEAGALGKVLVLSDLPAYRGLWQHGRNCLLHPVGDPELLALSLRILLEDKALRLRLGDAARQTAHSFKLDLFQSRLDIVLGSLD